MAPPSRARYQMPDPTVRLTDELIMRHIRPNSRVLDLGCGDGRLMHRLREELHCRVQGVDVEYANIVAVIARGLPAIAADLDRGLADFPDSSFDFVVLSQTLQQVRQPGQLLEEMVRVANRALVVVPNFGHWRVRWEVLARGRTPVTCALPYAWHETPNLHFMSMRDFRDLMDSIGLRIVEERPIIQGRAYDRLVGANIRADSAFYMLERARQEPAIGTPHNTHPPHASQASQPSQSPQ